MVAEPAPAGKEARARTPRSSHAPWEPAGDRPDPVAFIEDEATTRVAELVPLRHERMAATPFAFFRGAAGIMAADLATTPVSGTTVQLCGDAHLLNFGAFGSPERNLVFDLNDFDETIPGPWEWDVKRLAVSIAIAARHLGLGDGSGADMAKDAVRAYRGAMRGFARMPALEVWYARMDESRLGAVLRDFVGRETARRFERGAARARKRDRTRAFAKLAETTDGGARIASDPPLVTPVEELGSPADADAASAMIEQLIAEYADTLPTDRRRLLQRYRYAHAARKVVGVGSVGTRCWVILLVGRDHGDPLFLQAKEAGPSALAPYVAHGGFDHEGRRVVEGQRLMQAASDILLGWLSAEGLDGERRGFYVRQLWDWKASVELETMTPALLGTYGRLCGWTLARAHARSGDAAEIAGYLGSGDAFDRALAAFADAYADQNERDYARFAGAIADGRLEAASPRV